MGVRIDIGLKIVLGKTVTLKVVTWDDEPALEVEFVQFDTEAQKLEHSGQSIFCSEVSCDKLHRSMRIYKLSGREEFKLISGEMIRANVESFGVSSFTTKDNRRKVYITLKNARRVFSWKHDVRFERDPKKGLIPKTLVVILRCGDRVIKERCFQIESKSETVLCGNSVYNAEQLVLPTGSILSVSYWQVSSVDGYLSEKRKVLGRLVSPASLKRLVSNLPRAENIKEFSRTDREARAAERRERIRSHR